MVIKNPFIAMIVSLSIIPGTLYSMHITKKYSQAFSKKRALRCCNQKNFIAPYSRERDEKVVSALVWNNLSKLTSQVTEDNKQEQLESIMAAINRNATTTKVYFNNEKPVGFINYVIYQPWHRKYIPFTMKPNAYINLLAVDKESQGKNIGSCLLNDVLDDCNKQSVYQTTLYVVNEKPMEHNINLYHTDEKLVKFYQKFNFYPFEKPGGKVMPMIRYTQQTYGNMLSDVISDIIRKVCT